MLVELVRAYDTLVRGCLGRRSARKGDGLVAVFSPTSFSVDCAMDIQREIILSRPTRMSHSAGLYSKIHIFIRFPIDSLKDMPAR
jgi:hypothetical protein